MFIFFFKDKMSMKFILIFSFMFIRFEMFFLNLWNSFFSFLGYFFICLLYFLKDIYGILIKIFMYYKGF